MTKLDFPDTPSTGQQFGSAGTVWRWDGTRWGSTAGSAGTRGQVAYAQNTVGQGGFTTVADITSLAVQWSANPARTYRTTVFTNVSNPSTANTVLGLYIADSAGSLKQQSYDTLSFAGTSSGQLMTVVETGLSGTVIRKAQLQLVVGAGSLSVASAPTYPAFILVEDITYEAGATGAGGSVPPAPRYVSTDQHLASANTLALPYTLTPLNVAITPLSANSKFLIRASLMTSHVGADDTWFFFFRNGAVIGNANTGSGSNAFRYHRFKDLSGLETAQIDYEYVDSPNTTALVNYIPGAAVRVAGGSQVIYFNRRGTDATIGGRSSMFVQEIP